MTTGRLLWAIAPLMTVAQSFPACQAPDVTQRAPVAVAALAAEPGPARLYVSPAGSDANSGLDRSRPLRTLGAAAARSRAGTAVLIAPGTYHEQLVTRTAGAPGHEIVFASLDASGSAVIDGSRLPWSAGSDQNQGVVELRHPHVKLSGLAIVNSKNTGIVLDADHLTVEACDVSRTQRHAISTDTGRQAAAGGSLIRNLAIRGNRIHEATLLGNGFGQPISIIADEFEIAANELFDNREIAIDVWLGARHGTVRDNIVHDNAGQTAIYVDGASYVRISGNRIYRNKNGIGVSSEDGRYPTHHIWVHDNVVYDNTGPGCFMWDRDVGAQDVLFAHNTLVRNGRAFRFAGRGNSARVIANLVAASGDPPLEDASQGSAIAMGGNVWLDAVTGFVGPERGDFRLTADSPAIGRGTILDRIEDDLGRRLDLSKDAAGQDRTPETHPDAGAFER